jgi:hypothetical protein
MVYYTGHGEDEEQVTADNAEHAEQVFHDDRAVNLWPKHFEINEVVLLDEPDPRTEGRTSSTRAS